MKNKMRLLIAAASLMLTGQAVAQSCDPTPEKYAVRIMGTDTDGEPTPFEHPYVAGSRNFYQTLENGWVFGLVSRENGWSVRVFENDQIGMATDLTGMTPPHGGAPNPRDILGWHFRNADNTAPNDGTVNAPQHLRAFIISPGLAGTAGYKPSTDPDAPRLMEPGPDDGIGWLKVIDYGLANPQPGQRARMNYLEFDACLSWPRTDADRDKLLDTVSLEYTDEDHENFGACGLDLSAYKLDARYTPRLLGGDMDADGAIDEVAQIIRTSDGKRGLALCRAGTWLETIGFDDAPGDIKPGYFDQLEAWHWKEPGEPLPPSLSFVDLPETDGAVLLLERIEKEAAAIYWLDGTLQGKHLFHFIEP